MRVHRVGDVRDDPEEAQIRRRVEAVDLALEPAQDVEERDEDRDLEEERQARGGRVDLVLLVEAHDLFLLALLVGLVLLLERLELRREHLEPLHRVDLLDGERHHHHPHHQREDDDRERPRETARRVQPLEDVREDVLERWRIEASAITRPSPWPPAEERLVMRVVDAAVAPRVAAQRAASRRGRPADEPELTQRVGRVVRAGRVVLAARPQGTG